MRNDVVALEHKANGVVAVGVPIGVRVVLSGAAVDTQVALGVLVEAANDVEQRGLAASRGAQNSHELALAKAQRHAIKGHYLALRHGIALRDMSKLQHGILLRVNSANAEGLAQQGACAVPASRLPHFSQGLGDAEKRLPLRVPFIDF